MIYQPRPTPRWTDEDTHRLQLMWAKGVPVKCIARELGRTFGAIQTRAWMLGLPQAKREAVPVVVPVPVRANTPPTGLPADLRYDDDPRARFEFDPLPAGPRGDITAAFCGDPGRGRGGA